MRGDEVLLITGTSRGLGLGLAEHFVRQGLRVIGCSRSAPARAVEGLVDYRVDVTNDRQVRSMMSTIRRTYGRIDVLLNSAGMYAAQYLAVTTAEKAHAVFGTNVMGTFLCSREAVKIMKTNHYGRIVNVSTIAVPLASPGTAIYGASKAAVEQLGRVLAREAAPDGITVNTLGLSIVEGEGMGANIAGQATAEALRGTILGVRLTMNDVIHAISFLASPESGALTGQTIYLGGI
jgi:3-oxoacyl-[acyl-carrier protein] reductase